MGTRRALACKLHLGEQPRNQSLHPGRGAGSALLRPASQLLPVAQHVHQRADEILCKLEGYNFAMNDILPGPVTYVLSATGRGVLSLMPTAMATLAEIM